MQTGILHLHTYFPMLLLLLVMGAIGASLLKRNIANKLSLFSLIFTHLQLLAGLVLLFLGDTAQAAMDQGMKVVMKDDALRRLLVEHPVAMLLTVVFITIGHKKGGDNVYGRGNTQRVIFFTAALALMLLFIPDAWWVKYF